jgi:hypothetical protein
MDLHMEYKQVHMERAYLGLCECWLDNSRTRRNEYKSVSDQCECIKKKFRGKDGKPNIDRHFECTRTEDDFKVEWGALTNKKEFYNRNEHFGCLDFTHWPYRPT